MLGKNVHVSRILIGLVLVSVAFWLPAGAENVSTTSDSSNVQADLFATPDITGDQPSHQYLTNGTYSVSRTTRGVATGSRATTTANRRSAGLFYTLIDGNYTVLIFNTTGSTTWTPPYGVSEVEYLVVGGGGEGGDGGYYTSQIILPGGGGGAGGVMTGSALAVSGPQPVVVGAGGTSPGYLPPVSGGNSVFGAVTAYGGGAGGGYTSSSMPRNGGSGGGGSGGGQPGGAGVAGQGNYGGTGVATLTGHPGGGGGGAGAPGGTPSVPGVSGNGGAGVVSSITGVPVTYGGGGGGGLTGPGTVGVGGAGCGGDGSTGFANNAKCAGTGGGGGGAGGGNVTHGAGGSGVVIIRFPTPPEQGDGSSYNPSLSSEGRYVAFESDATNLVTNDTNQRRDIFVHELQPGTTDLISKRSTGALADGNSYNPSLSADDARYVAFESDATNLVAGDTNQRRDIFLRDRQLGKTSLISMSSAGVLGNRHSYNASISKDGRNVTFESDATNLVSGDTNKKRDIFVRYRPTSNTSLISVSSTGTKGNGSSYNPSISSGDGRYVAFESDATNLVSGDTNKKRDIFVRDRAKGTTVLISRRSTRVEANGSSYNPSISADGRYVAFESTATNLVDGDTNGMRDIFVRDWMKGTTILVSRSSAGVAGNGNSFNPSISADGRNVTFESMATNLVAGDTNRKRDIFVYNVPKASTILVSTSSAEVAGNEHSFTPSVSPDGGYVAFQSPASNFVPNDLNHVRDIFVRDRKSGTTNLVSVT